MIYASAHFRGINVLHLWYLRVVLLGSSRKIIRKCSCYLINHTLSYVIIIVTASVRLLSA